MMNIKDVLTLIVNIYSKIFVFYIDFFSGYDVINYI